MGAIRLILAIAVVINHTGPIFGYTLLRGNVAVQSFYILSGFFMAFILEEKYFQTKSPFQFFITNRILRIFPIYWSILAITFFICLISLSLGGKSYYFEPYLKYSSNLNIISWGYLIVSQIVLFFQDAILFLGLNTTNGNFFYIPYLYSTQPVVFHFLIVPQAWTLGLELSLPFSSIFASLKKFRSHTNNSHKFSIKDQTIFPRIFCGSLDLLVFSDGTWFFSARFACISIFKKNQS